MHDPLVGDLAGVVGDTHVLADPDLRRPYEVDWTRRYQGTARCVVRPASTDEVAEVVRICAGHGVGIVPQGGNTGLVGGSIPRDGEVVVSTVRLDDLTVDAVATQIVAGGGATVAAV